MLPRTLQNQTFLVLGLGISGLAAASFLLEKKARVFAVDKKAEELKGHKEVIDLIKEGLVVLSEEEKESLNSYDCLILSPGISPSHPLVLKARLANIPVMGEIELGALYLEGSAIGITGTNGKTTTTFLLTHLLNSAKRPAASLGNSGVPLTKELSVIEKDTEVVLELSSYQLETFSQKVLDYAILLNITPDHLDRYSSMQEYARAKVLIERNLKPEGVLYSHESVWNDYAPLFEKKPRLFGTTDKSCYLFSDGIALFIEGKKMCDLPEEMQGKKDHNLLNFMAAFAVCIEKNIAPSQIMEGLQTFKKPPHRVEFVRTFKGVCYYDDSKGTNIDAVIHAVCSLHGKIVLIAGGVDKGFSYHSWIEHFKDKVKMICLIGQAAAKIRAELSDHFDIRQFSTLKEAFACAVKKAEEGENVMLSPGCASFDMFRDYAHRGEEFQRLVHEL